MFRRAIQIARSHSHMKLKLEQGVYHYGQTPCNQVNKAFVIVLSNPHLYVY